MITTLSSFLTVGTQVAILFILVGVGFLLGKLKKIDEHTSLGLTDLVIYVISPAMQVVAFQRPLEEKTLHLFGVQILLAAAVQILVILLILPAVRSKDARRRRTLQFSASFSNCGFMAFPLQTSLLGSIGIFYGSAYSVVFAVLVWTFGVYLLTGDKRQLNWKPLLLNPGIIGSAVALTLYLGKITLPPILFRPLELLSYLNTPLPMLILGYQLSQADLRSAFRGWDTWCSAGMRLIVSPLCAIALCWLFHVDKTVAMATVIAASAPPAMLLSMFSAKFGGDTSLSSSVVSFHTLLSALTMPLMLALAQMILR